MLLVAFFSSLIFSRLPMVQRLRMKPVSATKLLQAAEKVEKVIKVARKVVTKQRVKILHLDDLRWESCKMSDNQLKSLASDNVLTRIEVLDRLSNENLVKLTILLSSTFPGRQCASKPPKL